MVEFFRGEVESRDHLLACRRGQCEVIDVVASSKARVVVVDAQPMVRLGLRVALGAEDGLDVVDEAGNGREAIALANRREIDVAIVELLMPDLSGLSVTTELSELQPRCRVLGFSVVDDPGLIADLLRAGASGYAQKTQPVPEVVGAIRTVLAGGRYLPSGVSTEAVDAELAASPARPLERLTRRERQVFELVIRGFSNDEIADRLFIARRTVETHRQRIVRKLSAHSIAELQRIAARHGGFAS